MELTKKCQYTYLGLSVTEIGLIKQTELKAVTLKVLIQLKTKQSLETQQDIRKYYLKFIKDLKRFDLISLKGNSESNTAETAKHRSLIHGCLKFHSLTIFSSILVFFSLFHFVISTLIHNTLLAEIPLIYKTRLIILL